MVGCAATEAVRGTWLKLLDVAPELWGSVIANARFHWATDHGGLFRSFTFKAFMASHPNLAASRQ